MSRMRLVLLVFTALVLSACQSFEHRCRGYDCETGGHHASGTKSQSNGLVVGMVMNARGRPELTAHERWSYADQLASHILASNPELSGRVDSYEYLTKRVGKPLKALLQRYRLEGELSDKAIDELASAQLRRRFLMLVSILPYEQSFPLKPDAEPVIGQRNREVHDYYDLNRQTVLLAGVRVQIYDMAKGRKILDDLVRSDEGGRTLATVSKSRQYVGNSLLAAISNTLSNGLSGADVNGYPEPPKRDDVLAYIWERIAEQLPGEIF